MTVLAGRTGTGHPGDLAPQGSPASDRPASEPPRATRPRAAARAARVVGAARPSGPVLGLVTLWLSVIVLLPLAALVALSVSGGLAGFVRAVTAPAAVAALVITVGVSLVVALVGTVMGTLVAWVLVRDEFSGKRLVNLVIDIPFALPTIVASIVLLSLYGPDSPVGIHLNATKAGLVVALLFVTLPFVVRSVQPVLLEADKEAEEAAVSLGASGWTTVRRIILPAVLPAAVSGAGLAFARALGEYGSVVLIGGGIPGQTQVASQYIQQQIEVDRPAAGAAVSVVLLLGAFVLLAALRYATTRHTRREADQ